QLTRSRAAARAAAEAIMTSDTQRKEIAVEFEIAGVPVRLGGICKGAGMIQPQMAPHATLLGFVTTDVVISSAALRQCLAKAVEQSFNRTTVDGDMSTNDTLLILANGLAGNESFDVKIFQRALNFVTLELAKMIVRDGEGVTRFVTLHVRGARTPGDAEAVARAVANSTLVKTSWFGGDPNWGRILCAIGYSKAKVDEAKIDVGYSYAGKNKMAFAVRRGQPTRVGLRTLSAIVGQPEFDLHIFLNAGRHDCVLYTSDLTEEYVEFNKGDLSDPKSLGG
ncbi:MAG TPA: bifunctional ornithine acetyltransferase/N-acetylglutamate synthase, partial [Chthoniobacterales bacterium]